MRRFVPLIVLLPCLVGADSSCTPKLIIGLENGSSEEVHLFGPDEDFDRSNRVAPNSQRTWRAWADEVQSPIVFTAGRNGTVLDTVSCTYTYEQGDRNTGVDLVWDGVSFSECGEIR